MYGYEAQRSDWLDNDVVRGVTKTTDKGGSGEVFKACPESVDALRDSINRHLDDPYGLSNKNARNCIGWACERLEDAGYTPPWSSGRDGLFPGAPTDAERQEYRNKLWDEFANGAFD